MRSHETDTAALWGYVDIVPDCNTNLGKDNLDKLTKREMSRCPVIGQLYSGDR